MQYKLPGTQIESTLRAGVSDIVFTNIFACGGLVLSQVSELTGLEPYVIQNWVKRGFLSPPVRKMYSRRQFCRIAIINMLKDSMQLDKITRLLSYINGVLSDESDDLVDDSKLYDYYVDTVSALGEAPPDSAAVANAIQKAISAYRETTPGAANRLVKVLNVMVLARYSVLYQHRAEMLMNELD